MSESLTQRSRIPELYAEGLSTREIGKLVGVSCHTVRTDLIKAGVKLRDHKESSVKLSPEEEARREPMIGMYESGMSLSQISKETGVSRGAVASWLKKKNVALRGSAEAAKLQGHTKDIPEREQIPQMYRDGLSIKEIAGRVGLTPGAVYSIINVRGQERRTSAESKRLQTIKRRAEKEAKKQEIFLKDQQRRIEENGGAWSAIQQLNDEAWLREELESSSAGEIADYLNCSYNSVRRACIKYGIDMSGSSDKQREAARIANTGKGGKRKPMSDETKEKIRLAALGKPGTNLGRKFTEEHKEKIRQANLGKKRSPESIERMKLAQAKAVKSVNDTLPEWLLQEELRKRGVAFERQKKMLGTPDIFMEPNICIFADGNYWHNLENNKIRDEYVNKTLKEKGFLVYRFWESDIIESCSDCIDKVLNGN